MTSLLELDGKFVVWIAPTGTADPSLQRLSP
jgi:hypothetical protein